jgi:hypothetical protein
MCFVRISEQTATLAYKTLRDWFLSPKWRGFTARYARSPYIKQIRFVFKGLIKVKLCNALLRMPLVCIRSYLKSVLIHKFLILDT